MKKLNFAPAAMTGWRSRPAIAALKSRPCWSEIAGSRIERHNDCARCWYEAGANGLRGTQYRYDPAYYQTYGCPADRRRHRRHYYERDYGDHLSDWPYYFHEFCRPDGHPT